MIAWGDFSWTENYRYGPRPSPNFTGIYLASLDRWRIFGREYLT